MAVKNLLEVKNLSKTFGHGRMTIRAVDNISFAIREGSTLGVLGESGSGKSTLGRCVLRLIEPDEGSIRYNGEELTYLTASEMRQKRQEMQMIFQNPLSALNPKMTVGENILDPFIIWKKKNKVERERKVRRLMDMVGLPVKALNSYPHEFSGGMQQRVVIARALALEPRLIICDEATSSLDVSVQAQIVNLLMEIQRELRLSYIFISHNLGVVEYLSDEVLILQHGRMKELSITEEIYKYPKNDYTRHLINSVPRMPTIKEIEERLEAEERRIQENQLLKDR